MTQVDVEGVIHRDLTSNDPVDIKEYIFHGVGLDEGILEGN